MAGNGR